MASTSGIELGSGSSLGLRPEMREIDRTVVQIAKQISDLEQKDLRSKFKFEECLEQIERMARDRRQGAAYSAVALVGYFPTHDARLSSDHGIQKWLGNTTRDFLQYLVFAAAAKTMRSGKKCERMTRKRLLALLKTSYEQLAFDASEFGIANRRDADFYIASDVERLFEIVLTYALKPTAALPTADDPATGFETPTPKRRNRPRSPI